MPAKPEEFEASATGRNSPSGPPGPAAAAAPSEGEAEGNAGGEGLSGGRGRKAGHDDNDDGHGNGPAGSGEGDGDRSPIADAAGTSEQDERVGQLLSHTLDVPVLAIAVEQQEAADAADTLETLDHEEAAEVLAQMDDQSAADALAEMQKPLAASVLEREVDDNAGYAGRLLTLMAPDDAADLLQAVGRRCADALLAAMPSDRALQLRRLMGYHEESAGGLMTTDFLSLRAGMTVAEAIDVIRRDRIPEGMLSLPVVSSEGQLVGRIGLRELLLGGPGERLAALMSDTVRAIRPDMDREQVAREFDRYDHSELPVVDERDKLVGVVTVDDVIDIIRAEQTEDVQMTVGAGAGEAVYSGLAEKFRGRFPWLSLSLLLTAMAAAVILQFEALVQSLPILAFLIPLIAALVGNAGHQSLAVTLRGIVLDEVRPGRVWPLVRREATVGLCMGLLLGVGICVAVGLLGLRVDSASWSLGAVAGTATALAMVSGTVAGCGVPLLMRHMGADPAQSSAIFLIMITDGVSFSILLGLAAVIFTL